MIDLDQFKAKTPLKDPSFYIALATSLVMLVFDALNGTVTTESLGLDFAAIGLWLAQHGYVRGQGATAAGEVAKSQTVMEPLFPSDDETADDPLDPPEIAGDRTAGYDEGVDAEGER